MIVITKYTNSSYESIDITKKCCEYFRDKQFQYDNLESNIALLEKGLINYSVTKLINSDVKINNLMQLDNLESICCLLNSVIPVNNQPEFFTQYVHCIMYIIGVIKKQQNQIQWLVSKEMNDEIEIEEMDNNIISITTNQQIPFYQLPSKLLEELKNTYCKEKNTIQKKLS